MITRNVKSSQIFKCVNSQVNTERSLICCNNLSCPNALLIELVGFCVDVHLLQRPSKDLHGQEEKLQQVKPVSLFTWTPD